MIKVKEEWEAKEGRRRVGKLSVEGSRNGLLLGEGRGGSEITWFDGMEQACSGCLGLALP